MQKKQKHASSKTINTQTYTPSQEPTPTDDNYRVVHIHIEVA